MYPLQTFLPISYFIYLHSCNCTYFIFVHITLLYPVCQCKSQFSSSGQLKFHLILSKAPYRVRLIKTHFIFGMAKQ